MRQYYLLSYGIGSMAIAVWFNDHNNYILGHILSVVVCL
jgi:hypothetical protein